MNQNPNNVGHVPKVVDVNESRQSFRLPDKLGDCPLHCIMRVSKISATLLLLGISGLVMGWTFKLNHLMGAEQIFNLGAMAAVVALLFFIGDIWKSSGP